MIDKTPDNVFESQVEGLVQHVAAYRDRRCKELRIAARTQARDLLRAARKEAAEAVRKAVSEERTRIEQGSASARARSDVEHRRLEQQQIAERLQNMWKQVVGLLNSRWNEPVHRREWILAAISQAVTVIGARPWQIEHGPCWQEADQAPFAQLDARTAPTSTTWALIPDIESGFRIVTDGVVFDATPAGLLARRALVEALFLAEYHE